MIRILMLTLLALTLSACGNLTLGTQGGVGAYVDAAAQKAGVGQYAQTFISAPPGEEIWDEYYPGVVLDDECVSTDGDLGEIIENAGMELETCNAFIAVHTQSAFGSTCVANIAHSDASWSIFGVQGTQIAATALAAPGTCEELARGISAGTAEGSSVDVGSGPTPLPSP